MRTRAKARYSCIWYRHRALYDLPVIFFTFFLSPYGVKETIKLYFCFITCISLQSVLIAPTSIMSSGNGYTYQFPAIGLLYLLLIAPCIVFEVVICGGGVGVSIHSHVADVIFISLSLSLHWLERAHAITDAQEV